MVHRNRLEAYLNELLTPAEYTDYAPNGLQVEGCEEIATVVTGVTASAALVEAACDLDADALIVHHGYFWKGEDPRVVGMKARRLRRLIGAGVNLFAYHLPLDVHPELGNNAGLARLLGLQTDGRHAAKGVPGLLWSGALPGAETPVAFAARLEQALGRAPLHVDGGPAAIRRVAWCSGGADGLIDQAADLGVDAFISGELSEPTTHVARERGLHYLAAGHHATERSGVQALGSHLAEALGLDHHYVEIDNPA
ncbi:MAG: Nif3-like dinuclear metal center hexameric protein [Halorhodospira halophila]|uniref:Nif3-like dinuclear metal center hexameric protein n=1 Tax=Halorhodospira TaxID=85108 RepID=UPI001911E270|nr:MULTISPECIES: Nif3-like dinuclear metal center hexameric protein [Halorhodospira]MBK5936721.1 Nif3-like dinuclear metal center hexameric protein [Halorhodospira halophila]MBK5944423.1 Nif3-like dinuclear metal center hexameric protein [Halorhodospira halophila]MCC3750550.1 Nif3-like dinuclear metal center hexameric protein [Halorhodospira halophila]MCG5527456.1 Nif3-like dinuclear metal center hexameric protein [Halorhodospira halophila]MCG5532824.1 Nif3-like dinuclear metal center hexameri